MLFPWKLNKQRHCCQTTESSVVASLEFGYKYAIFVPKNWGNSSDNTLHILVCMQNVFIYGSYRTDFQRVQMAYIR